MYYIVGIVYHGVNIVLKQDVAIKLEAVEVEHSQVKHKYQVYKNLANSIGIPAVHWFGMECDYNVLVLERLGPSLEDLFNLCNCKFDLQTVLLLADQLVHVKHCISREQLY
jgi:casein kinase I homolog HRR25